VVNEPRFWGSWKGRVISAIVLHDVHDWRGIQHFSELSSDILRKVLKEMFDLEILKKPYVDTYWLTDDIYDEYRNYYDLVLPLEKEVIPEPTQPRYEDTDVIKWISEWGNFKNLDLSIENRHFFLQGRFLDDFSKDLISQAQNEVVVINPFVDCCHLSNALSEISKHEVTVKLVTRDPEKNPLERFLEEKKEYHTSLKNDGVDISYNNTIHAKIIIVDNKAAIISSMNFQSSSSGGRTWEAGVVSFDENVVKSILDSIKSI
jgi:phosphatidylserine/phosphatidylglycerophosphate/cardiolipin synthase-like enzyme